MVKGERKSSGITDNVTKFTHRAIADLVIVKKMLHEEKPAKRKECDL